MIDNFSCAHCKLLINKVIAVEEQNSFFLGGGGTKNLPECSKQNISKCIVSSPKKKVFTKIFPFFLIGLV